MNNQLKILNLFRGIDPNMTLNAMQVFFIVANRQGISITEIEKALKTTTANASRNVDKLSEVKADGKKGYGLVVSKTSDHEARLKEVYLTTKGKELVHRISKVER